MTHDIALDTTIAEPAPDADEVEMMLFALERSARLDTDAIAWTVLAGATLDVIVAGGLFADAGDATLGQDVQGPFTVAAERA
ncbi:hypothetical protein ICW40_00505 [Actinotalea ferrariae]|uniref:hypothetical protein n=1 Tax=Actinotalea ferrariae TaxID=1386098 RepID=UPI001C8B1876|nr:hypothetical protein [Actinotalea ferrariae]MBX9243289.1 hypothetical protein [Actinotalea ferrariae]